MVLNAMAKSGIIKKSFEHVVDSLGGELRLRVAAGQHRRSDKIRHVLESKSFGQDSIEWAKKTIETYKREKPTTKYDDFHRKLGHTLPRYSMAQIANKAQRMLKGESLLPAAIKLKNRILSAKYLQNKLPEGKILSYFLQLTPEASMCSQVPEFADQEYLIEQIAIHGKYGYTVVVKEHPICFGNRRPQFYKELGMLPNVVLMHPGFPTRNMILRSEAVVVATGTSPGLESIASGIPVLCLGNPYFNVCKNTVKVEKPHEVWSALEHTQSNEKDLIEFIAAMHHATYEHPQFDNLQEVERGRGVGKILGQALMDEISFYDSQSPQ
ncbi:hypothetical protein D0S45_05570 [Marinifilum sp. JC120]|nr:hypothetical protein D0S45_05570 [Marinifilum sp. JC120]